MDITVDIGKGDSKGVSTLFMVGHDGIYHPIAQVTHSMNSLDEDLDKDYRGRLTYTMNVSFTETDKRIINMLLHGIVNRHGRYQRKTTYKTTKRNCAKRNR